MSLPAFIGTRQVDSSARGELVGVVTINRDKDRMSTAAMAPPIAQRTSGQGQESSLDRDPSGDLDVARGYFQRVVDDHPRSDEAALARSKLNSPNI